MKVFCSSVTPAPSTASSGGGSTSKMKGHSPRARTSTSFCGSEFRTSRIRVYRLSAYARHSPSARLKSPIETSRVSKLTSQPSAVEIPLDVSSLDTVMSASPGGGRVSTGRHALTSRAKQPTVTERFEGVVISKSCLDANARNHDRADLVAHECLLAERRV